MIREAEAAAKKDATRDVNQLAWFGAGMVAGFGFPLAGYLIGEEDSAGELIGAGVGLVVGSSIPPILIYTQKPDLPPERFIGKSPEYIDHYTEIYRKRTRWVRTKAAVGGCFTLGLMGITAIAVIAAL